MAKCRAGERRRRRAGRPWENICCSMAGERSPAWRPLAWGPLLPSGAIVTAVVAALVGNEINREKMGDQGMIDVMRQRPWQGSAAGNALKNEINVYIQGVGPVRVHSDPTNMNTTVTNRGNFIDHRK